MDSFAFIIHPISVKSDVQRKYPLWGRLFSERQIDFLSTFFPPVFISKIEGVQSQDNGKIIDGWFIACPYTPRRMLSLPVEVVYRKIIQTGHMAERLGANILGLGALTAVVGDAGVTVARALDVPVTTGDAYTVAIAVQTLHLAARRMGISFENTSAAIVGATGAIGKACAELLAGQVAELHLIGRRADALHRLQDKLAPSSAARLSCGADLSALRRADLILSVSSSAAAVIEPEHLRSGCIVCDMARPRDVAAVVAARRKDVLIIDGGMVAVPGNVEFNFDFGLPRGQAYACMAETMALALEGRFEDYTLGRDISIARVLEISAIAARHGFRLGGLRSFDRVVTDEHIGQVRSSCTRPYPPGVGSRRPVVRPSEA